MLVEREGALAALETAVSGTEWGVGGRLVLVAGEAGAGKTSLLRTFLAGLPTEMAQVVGACDQLLTARPAAPLFDWFSQEDGSAVGPVGPSRRCLFDAALRLVSDRPVVAVIEDAQWADEATIDVIKVLARRLHALRALLVVSYRSDEVVAGHPLFSALGELASVLPERIAVPPLTVDGVAALADGHAAPEELHARTGGNAFFVTECLSAGEDSVPVTVRQAVLARVGQLNGDARRALDAVSVVPSRAELWLAEQLGANPDGIDQCVVAGVLIADRRSVRFRHELAREAVQDTLPPHARQALHVRAMAALASPPGGSVDHARVVHHAVEADDDTAVLAHAPLAAGAAGASGAHREAVAHLELAVERAWNRQPAEQLDLWERLASERTLVGRAEQAIDAYETAIKLAQEVGADERRGLLHVEMCAPLTMAGRVNQARRASVMATQVLEQHPPGAGLALAYAQCCTQHMLARQLPAAEPWGRAAIDLAQQLGDEGALSRALIQSGVALWMGGDAAGLARLRRGVDIAGHGGFSNLVAQGLVQIGSGGGEVRHYREAVPALRECIDFAERNELNGASLYAQAWLGRCEFELGRWPEATAILSSVLRSPRCADITRMTVLAALGRLRARRGDPEVWPALDEAMDLARPTGHLQRLWPVTAARAEAAWLEGRLEDELGHLRAAYQLAEELTYPWAVGELGFWLWRAGEPCELSGAAEPFALHVAGRAAPAAEAWAGLGCPYEQAEALATSRAETDQRAALAIFERLGAGPVVRRLAEDRRRVETRARRGPNASTRANPGGLTDRELEVLALVAAGHTNTEIASDLHISAKTAGHHVSHLLTKLGARSRTEAITLAVVNGIPLGRELPAKT